MIQYLYDSAYATTTAPALLSEIDVSAFLAEVVGAVGDNFSVIAVVGATIVAVILGFWLLRQVVALFPGVRGGGRR